VRRHAVTAAIEDVQQAGPASDYGEAFAQACDRLSSLLNTADMAARQQNLAVSLRAQVLHKLLLLLCDEDLPQQAVLTLTKLCTEAMQLVSNRDAFSELVRTHSPNQ
jgi:hypothetical protein